MRQPPTTEPTLDPYAASKIFQLVCDDAIYLGSTKTELRKRYYEHKVSSRKQTTRVVAFIIMWSRLEVGRMSRLCLLKTSRTSKNCCDAKANTSRRHVRTVCA